MENSTTFVAYEELIKSGWLKYQSLDLEKALEILEKHGLINAREHEELLNLAKKIGMDASSKQSP